jgi:hypothetical protein
MSPQTTLSNTTSSPPPLTSPSKHLPRHNQNPHLKTHPHNPEPKNHIPVLARRALQQPHQRINIQPPHRIRIPIPLASPNNGSKKLRRRPDHSGQVEDEEDEGFEDHEAREEAALEGEQDDDPDEDFGCGADCDAVGDDPICSLSVRILFGRRFDLRR